jgi:hypothetical protein
LVRTRSEITDATSTPIHPRELRCSAAKYREYVFGLAPRWRGASTPVLAPSISERVLTRFTIEADAAGERLDRYLAARAARRGQVKRPCVARARR